MSVTVIPAVTVIPQVAPVPRKKRCTYYARVSSLHDEQISSNENQALHFQSMLANDPDIIALPGYIDTGISGTQLKNRIAFNQMMEDARAGKIDRIYTKSLSRWARNTLDSIKTTRELRDLGVEVIFEKENLSNMDSKSEVIFSLLASIAQAESQSIASNIRTGIAYHFQQGKQMINCSRFLGYSKDPLTKQLVIEPSEAATVRYIYRAFLEGMEPEIIAKRLREAKVPSGVGRTDWPVVSVRYILTNERYKGCALLQKTMVKDTLTHRSVKNEGKLPQYYITDSHPAIVPEEVWDLVQYEIARRGKSNSHPGQRKYALTGKVICGRCGSEFKRFAGQRYRWVTTAAPDSSSLATVPSEPSDDEHTLIAAPDTTSPAADNEAATSADDHTGQEDAVARVEATLDRPTQEDVATPTEEGEEDVATLDPTEEGEDRAAPSPLGRTDRREKVEKIAIFTPVWKCRARYDAKSAAKVAPRKYNPKRSVSGTWRCDNRVVDEEEVERAVARALEMLPAEVENIRHIQEQAREVIAIAASNKRTAKSRASNSSAANSRACVSTDTNSIACDGTSPSTTAVDEVPCSIARRIDKKVAAAQLLLLHTCTALRFLNSSCDGEREGRGQIVDRGHSPLRNFEEFAEMDAAAMTTVAMKVEAMDLIDAVVVDGDEIRVRFKAGVEI